MTTRGGESEAHRDLKRRGVLWAMAHGFSACAMEVSLPRSRYRADVAGCAVVRNKGTPGETVILECKQARSDLLRDSADERRTLERLREVTARREKLERMLGAHLPDLRRGETLFAEYDVYDLDAIRHDGLREVRREESRLRAKVYGATKLAKLMRYRCAERHYLVVSAGVLAVHEVPDGWGLLEARGDGLEILRRPVRVDIGDAARVALLQAVALAASRRLHATMGIDWEAVEAARRDTLP